MDLLEELKKNPSFPAPWRAEIGKPLMGRIINKSEGKSGFDKTKKVPVYVVIDESSGEKYSVWLSHKVLADEFARENPQVGQRIGILRKDDGYSEAMHKNYHVYRVVVDREEGLPTEPTGEVPAGAIAGSTAEEVPF